MTDKTIIVTTRDGGRSFHFMTTSHKVKATVYGIATALTLIHAYEREGCSVYDKDAGVWLCGTLDQIDGGDAPCES